MAFQPVPGVVEVILDALLFGQQCITTFFFRPFSGTITLSALEDLTPIVVVSWLANCPTILPDAYSLLRVVATDLTEEPQMQSISITTGSTGTQDSMVSNNACLSVKRSSAFVGRSNRGRVYWPLYDLAIVDTSPNQITPTAAGLIIAGIQGFNDDIQDEGWIPVIVSRYSGGVERIEGVYQDVVGWSVADFNVDSMRRRLAGRGS